MELNILHHEKKLFLPGIFFVENGDRLDAYYFLESLEIVGNSLLKWSDCNLSLLEQMHKIDYLKNRVHKHTLVRTFCKCSKSLQK